MVEVKTSYIYNIRVAVVIVSRDVGDVKDKWIGDNNSGIEKSSANYIKQELKL